MLIVLPLRVPEDSPEPIEKQLSTWLRQDDNSVRLGLNPAECIADLLRLQRLRAAVSVALDSFELALERIETLQEYASVLKCFEERGFDATTLVLPWRCIRNNATIALETCGSLRWERANVIWNLVSIEGYQATLDPLRTKVAWNKACIHLQNAASLVNHLRNVVIGRIEFPDAPELSAPFLETWQNFLLAEAQRAAYHTFGCNPRPRHFMLAKLAAAAVPLFQKVENACELLDETPLPPEWPDAVRAWNMWMTALTEYHQSVVHKERQEWGVELARLYGAIKYGKFCRDYCDSIDSRTLDGLQRQLHPVLTQMEERLLQAEHAASASSNRHAMDIPPLDELPEVPPQVIVKIQDDVTKVLPNLLGEPLFQNRMDETARRYMDVFHHEMQKKVGTIEERAEQMTENARQDLASMQLPHSLTAYKQQASGGGVPIELWERIESLQQNRGLEALKRQLWEIRELAADARSTYNQIADQLEEDLQMDGLFRENYPDFEGHDVTAVQKNFREAMAKYDRLMLTAGESDKMLLRRSEILDSDPRFRLLMFEKTHLDRLIPARQGNSNAGFDVALLSQYLVRLSELFREREMILQTFRDRVQDYDVASHLAAVSSEPGVTEAMYREVVDEAKCSFLPLSDELEYSYEAQDEMLRKIRAENEAFVHSRSSHQSSTQHSNSDLHLVKIEDALDEIDQLASHLKEGMAFYDVIIPKLLKLKHQVSDVSTRLAVERYEYEDRAARSRQEEDDARMAASLASDSNTRSNPAEQHPASVHESSDSMGRMSSSDHSRTVPNDGYAYNEYAAEQNNHYQHHHQDSFQPLRRLENRRGYAVPGVESVPHDEPDVRVDDQMLASLVDMDFDPEKVVAALKKYDNNFDQALNELLSG